MGYMSDKEQLEQQWQNDYKDYEKLGDAYSEVNCNQAYLCYENAAYLCAGEAERQRILDKKHQMSQREGFCVHRTSIVIVSYNCMYMMQKCLESIRETCSSAMCETIVVENASKDGVREWLIQQEDEKIILLEQNVGFPMGCNIGVEYAEPDNDIFLLNNDTRMTPNALFWLRMGLYENANVGACGCVANYCGNAQEIDVQFSLPGQYVKYGAQNNVYKKNPYEERNRLCGFAMLIKRCAWNATQGVDEAYTPGYLDDDDLSMQLRKASYRLLICHNSYIYHAGSQNFSKLNNLEQIITNNYLYLLNKWHFDVPNKSQVYREAVQTLGHNWDDSFSVLHIGAGCGSTLARIKFVYPNAEVYGIENCREAVECAPDSIEIIYCDFRKDEFPYDDKRFDYIICSDNTEKERYSQYLTDQGVVITLDN